MGVLLLIKGTFLYYHIDSQDIRNNGSSTQILWTTARFCFASRSKAHNRTVSGLRLSLLSQDVQDFLQRSRSFDREEIYKPWRPSNFPSTNPAMAPIFDIGP